MYNKIDWDVVKQLFHKKIIAVGSNGSKGSNPILTLRFDDGSELVVEEGYERGGDGGMYQTTKFILKNGDRSNLLFKT